MKLVIMGTGYVGLVTGACLADFGHQVVCIDTNPERIKTLKEGKISFYEPGLEKIVKRNFPHRLTFSLNGEENIKKAEAVFICVGTPSKEDGSADLSSLYEVAKKIGKALNNYKVIIIKSTVPPGTSLEVKKLIIENSAGNIQFDIASNPEFLREGSAVEDFIKPDRIIFGAETKRAFSVLKEIFSFVSAPIVETNLATSEMIKYASNAFLATKVSFINAISRICEQVGADIQDVALGMGYDKRIGFEFLRPGPGFGGSCFPKDCKALLKIAGEGGYEFKILKSVLETNEEQKLFIVSKLEKNLGDLKGKLISILGLAFKAETDDVRESPAVGVAQILLKKGTRIRAYDPKAMENAKKVLSQLIYCANPYEACEGVEAILVLTEWEEFKNLDFKKIKRSLKKPIIIDARNLLNGTSLKTLGYNYVGVGR